MIKENVFWVFLCGGSNIWSLRQMSQTVTMKNLSSLIYFMMAAPLLTLFCFNSDIKAVEILKAADFRDLQLCPMLLCWKVPHLLFQIIAFVNVILSPFLTEKFIKNKGLLSISCYFKDAVYSFFFIFVLSPIILFLHNFM